MPPKRKNEQGGSMEARVTNLENEVTGLKAEILAMRLQAEETHVKMGENHDKIMAILLQGKTTGNEEEKDDEGGDEGSEKNKTPRVKKAASAQVSGSLKKLQGDQYDEFRQSVKKVELPMFNGDDPGWISRAEVYFRVQDTHPEVRVSLAQLCMEGPTIHFFNSLLNEDEDLTWDQLKAELVERYEGEGEGDVFEQLSDLRQKGSIEDYIQSFERLTAQIKKLPEDQFFGYFLHGLKEDVRGRIRSLRALGPLPRSKLMNLARAVEKEFHGRGRYQSPTTKMETKSGPGLHYAGRASGGSVNRPNHSSDWVYVKGGERHEWAQSIGQKRELVWAQ